MKGTRVVVVGGGAAGIFAAIACAERSPQAEVIVLEKGPQFLAKVRISGGGRCNVTHSCFDSRALADFYPRGGQSLIGPFKRFGATDTVRWFADRGVKLKTEADGRMFPITDSSQTIIDCLLQAAREAGVSLRSNCEVREVRVKPAGQFEIRLSGDQILTCDRLLLAMGGCRGAAGARLAEALGHSIEPPVPSLFTFHVDAGWLRPLSGVSVEKVEARVPALGLRERGPILVTHWGLSGPVILRLSSWGARELHGVDYAFELLVNWLPDLSNDALNESLRGLRQRQAAKQVANTPLPPLSRRLWEALVSAAEIASDTQWAQISRGELHALGQQLGRTTLQVSGKSLNKDEFVTCGGVRLKEVNFQTMESRLRPGLFFAGELLDIDALTGGFNFQAAWTTGWIAGNAMAENPS